MSSSLGSTRNEPPPQRVAIHHVVSGLMLLDERVLIGDRIIEWCFSDDDSDFDQRWVIRRTGPLAVPRVEMPRKRLVQATRVRLADVDDLARARVADQVDAVVSLPSE